MTLDAAGIDPALVRLTLAELADDYGQRIARAPSGAERAAHLLAWAVASRRELAGIDTDEARNLHSLYSAVVERARA